MKFSARHVKYRWNTGMSSDLKERKKQQGGMKTKIKISSFSSEEENYLYSKHRNFLVIVIFL